MTGDIAMALVLPYYAGAAHDIEGAQEQKRHDHIHERLYLRAQSCVSLHSFPAA